jgi:iron complex outermembrane receptor protein
MLKLYRRLTGPAFIAALATFLLLIVQTNTAQTPADSLLPEVTVTATVYGNRSEEVAASVATLNSKAFEAYGEATPLYGLNTLAGVQFQERAPGSYRLAIRGSALRSPFGVRNVKVYLNGLPFTEANGSTPLNLLDVALYRQVSVVKGPAASYYGAGTGGVLTIYAFAPDNTQSYPEAELALGSYGYNRQMAGYTFANENQQWRVGVSRLRTNGYRTHSELDRLNAYWVGKHRLNDRQQLESTVLLAQADYDIPGGLTREQFAADPTQARPGNRFALGSEESNAGVDHTYALLGLGHQLDLASGFSNSTYLYGNTGLYLNPFNTDYKRDAGSGVGGRSIFSYEKNRWKLQAGGEYQYGFEIARNYGNVGGQPDTLNFSDEVRSTTGLLFIQADGELVAGWSVSGGLSYNRYHYTVYRLQDATNPTAPYELDRPFNSVWAPRLGISKQLNPAWQLWAQVSRGFSPPTLDEVRTNEGSFNSALEAEQGINYELGTRNHFINDRINWQASVYHFRQRQSIISFTDTVSTVTRFRNAGNARQWGVESQLDAVLYQSERQQLALGSALTFQRYILSNFSNGEEDFSGNRMPGVPRWSTTHQLTYNWNDRLRINATHYYLAELPLNNTNTEYSDSYHLLNARVDYTLPLKQATGLTLFVSGQNLLNETYSLGFDLNPFGQRYFQPAPTRNWVVGVVLGRI